MTFEEPTKSENTNDYRTPRRSYIPCSASHLGDSGRNSIKVIRGTAGMIFTGEKYFIHFSSRRALKKNKNSPEFRVVGAIPLYKKTVEIP